MPDDKVERMRKDIEIELVHDRDELTAFNVYYSSHDPHMAQKVTSELTNLFISENMEMRQRQSQDTTNFWRANWKGPGRLWLSKKRGLGSSKISIPVSCRPSCKAISPSWPASNLSCRMKKMLSTPPNTRRRTCSH